MSAERLRWMRHILSCGLIGPRASEQARQIFDWVLAEGAQRAERRWEALAAARNSIVGPPIDPETGVDVYERADEFLKLLDDAEAAG